MEHLPSFAWPKQCLPKLSFQQKRALGGFERHGKHTERIRILLNTVELLLLHCSYSIWISIGMSIGHMWTRCKSPILTFGHTRWLKIPPSQAFGSKLHATPRQLLGGGRAGDTAVLIHIDILSTYTYLWWIVPSIRFYLFFRLSIKNNQDQKNDLQWVSLLLQAIHAIGHCFVAATCDSRQLTCLFAQRIELERDVSLPPLQIPIGKFSSVEKKPRRNGTSPAVSLDVAIENEFVHSTFSWSVTKERCCRLQKFDRSFFVSRKQIAPARSLSPWQHSTENYLFIRIATDRCKESGKPEQYW